jgi:hypothetical protein
MKAEPAKILSLDKNGSSGRPGESLLKRGKVRLHRSQ